MHRVMLVDKSVLLDSCLNKINHAWKELASSNLFPEIALETFNRIKF